MVCTQIVYSLSDWFPISCGLLTRSARNTPCNGLSYAHIGVVEQWRESTSSSTNYVQIRSILCASLKYTPYNPSVATFKEKLITANTTLPSCAVAEDSPWKHSLQQSVCFLLLFNQLTGSLHHQLLQVIRVLLHHVNYVVKDVGFPVEWSWQEN